MCVEFAKEYKFSGYAPRTEIAGATSERVAGSPGESVRRLARHIGVLPALRGKYIAVTRFYCTKCTCARSCQKITPREAECPGKTMTVC